MTRRNGWCDKHYQRWRRWGDPLRERSIADRFWSKVNFDGPIPDYAPHLGPCWLWEMFIPKDGYGRFNVTATSPVLAHRWAYEFCVGPIPEGLTLDHLCRVHCCVHPWHVEPVTIEVNILRGYSPPANNARKAMCKRGHALTGTNLRLRANGWRRCVACGRIHEQERSPRTYTPRK